MSDTYEIRGVKITPSAGGYYDLEHSTLTSPERVRGKENADRRAEEIAGAASQASSDGTMAPQPPLESLLKHPPQDDRDAEIERLKAQIASMQTRTVEASDAPQPPVGQVGVPSTFHGVLDDKAKAKLKERGIDTTDIILEESEHIPPTGLFVGHNGRGYMIKPGEKVTVPNFVLGVLDDAVTSTPVTDNVTKKVLGHRSRSKYPYRRV